VASKLSGRFQLTEERPTIRCSGRAEKSRIVQDEEHNARLFSTPLIWALGTSMKNASPAIHAVVEVAVRKGDVWVDLPPEPWPPFVRLSRATTEEEVALVVGTLSSCRRAERTPAQSAEDLVSKFPSILPGGFAVLGNGKTILPSCCCGLEAWREWLGVRSGAGSPWMGHDPAPLVEVHEDHIYVWSDGAIGSRPAAESPVVFTPEQFDKALEKAVSDLEGFKVQLSSWLNMYAPRSAAKIVEKFTKVFIAREA
jgi:hypothetical protein